MLLGNLRGRMAAALLILVCQTAIRAEDAFFEIALHELEILEGARPNWNLYDSWIDPAMRPRATLDQPGEVFVWSWKSNQHTEWRLVARSEIATGLTGKLFLPAQDGSRMEKMVFSLPPSARSSESGARFYLGKAKYYASLVEQGIPGAPWFRFRSNEAHARRGLPAPAVPEVTRGNLTPDEWDRTFDFFSGARAVAENLQFDRALPASTAGESLVPIENIPGVTVSQIDWAPIVKGWSPEIDPLAPVVPADQHAVFFRDFKSLVALLDELKRDGSPVARLVETRSEDDHVSERYQRQLGIPLTTLGRLLGPTVIDGVAITGSDPYFFAGTDVAVLFQTSRPELLRTTLAFQIGVSAQAEGIKAQTGKVGEVEYTYWRSPDRRVSSYLVAFENLVAVSNSPVQLARLASVHRGETPSLASLDEFKFFRHRYPRSDSDETAFLFLSDATIRRWCGPRWRIADARRVRAAVGMAANRAEYIDRLARGENSEPAALTAYGGVGFLTPIVELELDHATQAEADAYGRWRDGYQRNWNWKFDPIGLRLTVRPDQLAGDLTIMPLIANTTYDGLRSFTKDMLIEPLSGDPHDTLIHGVCALSPGSMLHQAFEPPRSETAETADKAEKAVTKWLGKSIAIYLEPDPVWEAIYGLPLSERAEVLSKRMGDLPIALSLDVSDRTGLDRVFPRIRTLIGEYIHGDWTKHEYRGQEWFKFNAIEGEIQLQACLAATPTTFLVTPSEALLKRSIDRQLDRNEPDANPTETPGWRPSSTALRIDSRAWSLLALLQQEVYQSQMQRKSWANLPILNEWRRLFPDRDPVAVHEEFWQTRLVCPGGGEYVWNEDWQTMESTAAGHPGDPKLGPIAPAALAELDQADFDLTFEEQGLRARAQVKRKTAPDQATANR